MRIRNPLWLPFLPLVVCLADIALTLRGQPAEYWQGDYAKVNEGNPLPRYFLELHPMAFGVLAVAWVGFFITAILLLPRRWAVFACLAIIFGHTIGTVSWLLHSRPFGPWFAVVFFITVVVLSLPTWRAGHDR